MENIQIRRGDELLGREETVSGLGLSVASVLQVELLISGRWQQLLSNFWHILAHDVRLIFLL